MTLSISVVTASLNQANFIEETIASVLGQNYPKLEYVIVDGKSTDGTAEIAAEYRSSLHHFVSEPDTGHANALNKNFARTSGEIMAWLNSDDKYLPWTFATVSEIFEQHPDVNWIVGINSWWNDKGAMIATANVYNNIFDYLTEKPFGIQQESCFWRRSLWNKADGYLDESYRFLIDVELSCRFFLLDALWHAGSVLSGYRIHGQNRATQFEAACIAERKRATVELRAKLDPGALQRMPKDYFAISYDVRNSAWAKHSVPRQPRKP